MLGFRDGAQLNDRVFVGITPYSQDHLEKLRKIEDAYSNGATIARKCEFAVSCSAFGLRY